MEKIKAVKNGNAKIDAYIKLLKSAGKDFNITISNYNISLRSDLFNIDLVTNERSSNFFAAKNKITKDLLKRPEQVAQIQTENATFFSVYNLRDCDCRTVFAFDITAAYPSALFKEELISPETFNYLMNKLTKPERLASVGSIAGKKTIQYYYDGQLCEIDVKESEFRKVFFYIVNKVAESMDFMNNWFLQSFKTSALFSWVDCIYIDVTDYDYLIRDIITENTLNEFLKLQYSVKMEVLTDFSCREIESGYLLKYIKKDKMRNHYVPKSDNPKLNKVHSLFFNN